MVQITLNSSSLQRLCACGLLIASWLAVLSLGSATWIKQLLILLLAAQSVSLALRQISFCPTSFAAIFTPSFCASRCHSFFSAGYGQWSLGSQFCSLEQGGRWLRFQRPKIHYCSEFLIILEFIPENDGRGSALSVLLRRWLGRRRLLLTPDSLSARHAWYLRRYLKALHED